jgi:hypothetical protein
VTVVTVGAGEAPTCPEDLRVASPAIPLAERIDDIARAERAGRAFRLGAVLAALEDARLLDELSARGHAVSVARRAELMSELAELLTRRLRTVSPLTCTGRSLLRSVGAKVAALRPGAAADVIRTLQDLLLDWRAQHPQDRRLVDTLLGERRGGAASRCRAAARNPWFRSTPRETAELLDLGRRLLS